MVFFPAEGDAGHHRLDDRPGREVLPGAALGVFRILLQQTLRRGRPCVGISPIQFSASIICTRRASWPVLILF